MRTRYSRSIFVAAACVSVWSAAPALAEVLAPVMVQTQVVPGDAPRTFLGPTISLSGLNASDKVVTWNAWNSGDQFPEQGTFTWQNGTLVDVIRSNDTQNAPGIGVPVDSTQPSLIDDNGRLAVEASYNGGTTDVVLVGSSRANLQLLAESNAGNAPGSAGPWVFISAEAINNGHVALYGRVGPNTGLWIGSTAANVTRLAQSNSTLVPGTALPITALSFESPYVNSAGTALFNATYGDETAVLIGKNEANLQVVARSNHLDIPGGPAGTKFTRVTKGGLNNAGHVVVRGQWGLNDSEGGLFTTARGIFEPIAMGGDAMPGRPGLVFRGDGFGTPLISGTDDIIFAGSSAAFSDYGIFRWRNGSVVNLVYQADAAAGTTSTFDLIQGLQVNASGDLVFSAQLEDDTTGIWYVPADSTTPQLVLREGQIVDVFGDGTDLRPITSVALSSGFGGPQAGQNPLFNDLGHFLVKLQFEGDGINTRALEGLYLVNVPEPTAALTLVTLLGGFASRRRPARRA